MNARLLALCTALTLASPLLAAPGKTDADALATLRQSNDRIVRFTLPNGMTCLIKEDRSAPVVSIQIWVGSGSIHEGNLLGAGLSHYVEHMVFKGTPTRKPGEIARTLIGLGGNLNAYTSLDRTVFHTDLPSRHWKAALETLADATMNASFPEDEWQREKDVVLREFSMGEDNPDRQLNELMWRTAFTRHPYRLPVIGLRDIFKSITREDLVDFYRRRYIPDNMVVAVVGNIEAAEVRAALETIFANFKRRPDPPLYVPEEPRQTAPRQVREEGPYKIARLAVAFHTVPLSNPDAAALDVLASVVGGGQSSRLVQSLKEDRKLVHEIGAWSFTPRDPGLFAVNATLDPGLESQTLAAIQETIGGWARTSFSRAEVEKARRMMLVGHLASLQTMHGQAASLADGQLFMGDPRYAETYLQRLQAVTPESLRDVARKYLTAENRSTVILGPPRETASQALPAAASVPSDVTCRRIEPGVPLILREDHRLPFVYVCAAFLGGVNAETETTSGLSYLMSELLLRGTLDRSAVDIASRLDGLGATLAPFSGLNSFGLQGQCLAGDVETLLDTMFDCLGNATFPTNEIEKAKTVQLAALDAQQEQPFHVAQEALNNIVFAGHPYRWTPLGRREAVSTFDQEALRTFHRRQVVTGNLALAIFGDLPADTAERLAARFARRVRKDESPARLVQRPIPELPARIERREPREQCIVLCGFPGVSLTDPRHDALAILESAMSGMSSKLFESVRDKRGLAYYASTRQQAGLDAGLFMLFAGTRTEALPEVERLMTAEALRVATQGLEPEEIARGRNQLVADHDMRLQDNGQLAMLCALNELYGLGYAREFTTRQRLEAVTPEQIRAAAASILQTNRMAVSIVIPGKPKQP